MTTPRLPQTLLDAATARFKPSGKFAYHFARGKLGGDPAFAGLLSRGWVNDGARVLDIGCGQGLFTSLMIASEAEAVAGRWPAGWAAAPKNVAVHGVELMPKDVERARVALADAGPRASFECADMCKATFAPCDLVVILDVLHYVPIAAQDDVLKRVHAALPKGGRLLLRVGDAAAGLPFKMSNWVDNVVMFVRGHGYVKLYCRPLADWQSALKRLGFECETVPMHEGTPFANIVLWARAV